MFLKKKRHTASMMWVVKLLVFGGVMMGEFLEVVGQKPELVVPIGHTGHVSAIACSPNGKYVLTGSWDHTAKLWNTQSGKEIRTFSGHIGWVHAVVFSPDGQYVLTGSADNTARLWNIRNGEQINSYEGHTNDVYAVAFSPDGQYILTGGADETAKLWDIKSGIELRTFNTYEAITDVEFSLNGRYILTGNTFLSTLWNVDSGKIIRYFKGYSSSGLSTAFSPDGQYVLTGNGGGTTKLWDAYNGTTIRTFKGHVGDVLSVKFSANGHYILTGSQDGTAKLWETQSGKEIRTFSGHTGFVNAIFSNQIAPDSIDHDYGQYVLTGSGDGTAKLWNTKSGQEIRTFTGYAPSARVLSTAFSKNGRYILTIDGGKAKLWDIQNGMIIRTFEHTSPILAATFTLNDTHILTGSKDLTTKIWNIQNRDEVKIFPRNNKTEIRSMTFSSDSRYGFTKGWDEIAMWETQNISGNIVSYKHKTFRGMMFSPDGKYILAGGRSADFSDYTAKLWDSQSGKKIREFKGNTKEIWEVAFSSDGQYILTGSVDNTVKLWNTHSGEEIRTIKGSGLDGIGFSSGGQYILIGSNGETKLWSTENGEEINILDGNKTRVRDMTFSSDGRYVLMSSNTTNKITLYNLQGQELATLISIGSSDWVVTNSDGLFDASPGAMKLMHFVVGLETIDLEQLKERYYEPGLLAKIMGYKEGGIRDVEVFDEVKLHPEIQASISNQQLNINLTERNGGIGKVSVFVNDKEVIQDANEGRKGKLQIDLNQFSKYYLPDTTNQIAIRAYNEEGWLKSQAYNLEYEPPKNINLNAAPPSLYAVVVGTAEYNGERLDLSFSDQDAKAMAEALKGAGGGLFEDRVNVALLNTDPSSGSQTATKTNIQAAFQTFAKEANPQDVLIVYFSGHGITYGSSETAQFYYLTKDIFSEDLSDPEIRNQYAISTNELTTWINDIPARKQVMILDACNSGRAVDDLLIAQKELNSTQIRALDRMKDRTGMFILAGSAADKASFEASQYGQGLLTYSLLSGMSGLALTADKRIDVMKLFQYSRDQVPELAKDIGGIQTPVLAFPYGGSSFDIGIVRDGTEIPISVAKPVFIRSKFLNSETFDDELTLEDKLNAFFRDLGSKGSRASILYVDVSKYEQAYRIAGQYQISGSNVNLTARLFKGNEDKGNFQLKGDKDDVDGLVEMIIEKVKGLL